MRVLDLFSGIGGLALGLERSGMQVQALCESDAFARSVLQRHWPGAPCFNDVRTLGADALRCAGLPRPDLVCGGFPCQDVSSAGRGGGIDGECSILWRELVRIVQECQPGRVLVENVPSLRVRGADRLLAALEAADYTCWPLVVGAVHAGARHRRQRVFIVGHSSRLRSVANTTGPRLESRQRSAASSPPGVHAERRRLWPAEPGLGRVVDGLPPRVDRHARLSALGNAVVPEVAQVLGVAVLSLSKHLL